MSTPLFRVLLHHRDSRGTDYHLPDPILNPEDSMSGPAGGVAPSAHGDSWSSYLFRSLLSLL